ncbi:Isovaleryl-CoA dehydrogenase, mitochondrial [Portunus trituberculatus]|uniref:Isovaleryl-CoA dehydrogenase, mitochondrial n=1 Tax=Portunus trituberculatus TaxID=210409 RepID=A0A5B7IWL2_PORTR|nr:Isovaleryl-CoA dehydrogenase, mitochondrial [Portunus trituberculatus]
MTDTAFIPVAHRAGRSWLPASFVNTLLHWFPVLTCSGNQSAGNLFSLCTHPKTSVWVYAKTDMTTSKPQHGVSAFLIEKTFDGFSTGQKLDKLGIRGSSTGELIFEDCKVPEHDFDSRLHDLVSI